jgi:hypothetical protein
MAFNLFGPPTKDDIRVGYIDPTRGYVDGFTICQANEYAIKNPGTTFVFRNGNNVIQYLNINEVNQLDPSVLISTDECGGINQRKECGPPTIQMFGGGGIGASGNPVVGRDGALLAVDVVRGGNGYQYPPIVAARDNCNYGSGATLTAVLGEVAETIETYENEADFEDYELCEPTDVGYGRRYGPDGEDLGPWEPRLYTEPGEDPIRKEVEDYERIVRRLARAPFWSTRKNKPTKITSSNSRVIPRKYDVTDETYRRYQDSIGNTGYLSLGQVWNEFMNTHAISPVSPSSFRGTDYATDLFTFEWEEEFPHDGEYIFRGSADGAVKQLYVDNLNVGTLSSYNEGPKTFKKTITKGIHKIRLDLLNGATDTTARVETRKVFNTLEFSGKANRTLWRVKPFRWEGTDTFHSLMTKSGVLPFDPDSSTAQRESYSGEHSIVWSNINFPVDGQYTIQFAVDDEVTLTIGDFQISISGNDGNRWREVTRTHFFKAGNYTIQAKLRQDYRGALARGNPMGFAMNITVGEVISDIVSQRSWNDNPMGIALTIDAPEPPVPQEPKLEQEGRCPPNPIWTTRFPGAKETWYPVNLFRRVEGAGNTWSKFMNRYAISPVKPLDTPGTDSSGTVYVNTWEIDIPYDGFYGVRGNKDNFGRLLIDGNEVSQLNSWNVENPTVEKVFITKGRHTITAEISNRVRTTESVINQKIFRTKDWQSGSKNISGVIYEGPSLFHHQDNRWSRFMNNHSVSPVIPGDPANSEGRKGFIWKGVTFPETGQYDIAFQADNDAKMFIGGREVLSSQGFSENVQIFKVNVTRGKYDIVIDSEYPYNSSETNTAQYFRETNPTGIAVVITKNVTVQSAEQVSWSQNPMGISAILIPPPCPRRIRGRGVVTDVIVNDPGNGYLRPIPSDQGYPVALRLKEVIVENPGINYNCGVDELRITPSNGAELDYICDPFGKIREVKVLNPGLGFTEYPEIRLISETGVNASFRPVFEVVRDPIVLPEKLIQVTDLVGLKQTGYVDGRAYYGAVYYDQGVRYAGFYETVGDPVRVYDTLQESITAQVTTPASAIERSGTDITSNDPRLNIPGTPENLI